MECIYICLLPRKKNLALFLSSLNVYFQVTLQCGLRLCIKVMFNNERRSVTSMSKASSVRHKHKSSLARLVQVPHDLLQQRVQAPIHLALFQQLEQLHVIGHQLPQVRHLLQDFGEQLERVGMVGLQLQLQRVKNCLLQVLDGLDVQQTGSICRRRNTRLSVSLGVIRDQDPLRFLAIANNTLYESKLSFFCYAKNH